jgi:LPS sulfotransferase NodH
MAGNPREWLNLQQEQTTKAQWRLDTQQDLSFEGYLEAARRSSTTPNGVSGWKVHLDQLARLPERMPPGSAWGKLKPHTLLPAMFPGAKYLWLTRRDKVRQAISLYLAYQTDAWWSLGDAPPQEKQASLRFDFKEIQSFKLWLEHNERRWAAFFKSSRLAPLEVHYEELDADYAGTVRKVLQWLELPQAEQVAIPPPRLRRQSDERAEQWAARYAKVQASKRGSGNRGKAKGKAKPGQKAERRGTSPSNSRASEPTRLKPAGPQRIIGRHDKPFAMVPDAWRQWVAHARLAGSGAEEISQVLVSNGYSAAAAQAESQRAASDAYLVAAGRELKQARKAAFFLHALAQVRRVDPRANVIERRKAVSVEEFRDRYYAANRPVLLQGIATGWKACRAPTTWTPEYLKRTAGNLEVEVMTGRAADPRYAVYEHRHRTRIRFAAFVDQVHTGKATNDYYMTANNRFFKQPGTAVLLKDLGPSEINYLTPRVDGESCFLWFGPAGTVTPLHHDTLNILLVQVSGRKRFKLIAPEYWRDVYNEVRNFSEVDCESPDFAKYPRFADAPMAEVVLEPGDALFIPVGWWHHARALEVSMSVTFRNFIYPNRFIVQAT